MRFYLQSISFHNDLALGRPPDFFGCHPEEEQKYPVCDEPRDWLYSQFDYGFFCQVRV